MANQSNANHKAKTNKKDDKMKKLVFEELRPGATYTFQVARREANIKRKLRPVVGKVVALYPRYVMIEIKSPEGNTHRECVHRFDSDNFITSKDPGRFIDRPDNRMDLKAIREEEGFSQEVLASFLPDAKTLSKEDRLEYIEWCEKEPRWGIPEDNYRTAIGRAVRFRENMEDNYEEMLDLHLACMDIITENVLRKMKESLKEKRKFNKRKKKYLLRDKDRWD